MAILNYKESSNEAESYKDKEELLAHGAVGVPSRIQRLSWMDVAAVAAVLIACILAVVAVLGKATAMSLGQTNQLVILGLVLSIMGFSTQRQVQKLTLLYEVRLGASTLQNFDAILRSD